MLLAVLAALFILACFWASVRDRYDQARWQAEPYYPRYGASNLRALRWWLGGALVVVLLLASQAVARDLDGRYAASPLKPWFDSLKSGKGPCCSDADGWALSDVDWETKGGRYRVRVPVQSWTPSKAQPAPPAAIEMTWVDVEADAVITEPNRAGRTMVWPLWGIGGVTIRCFMPGSMT